MENVTKNKYRLRIAPSPTGYPHIGTIYQALFNYAYAKKYGGSFVVRIEDTDRTRFVEDAEEVIFNCLDWFGLAEDESPRKNGEYGPYRQSERLEIYHKYAQELVDNGYANFNFHILSNYLTYPLDTTVPLTDNIALNLTQSLLNNMQLMPTDVDPTATSATDYVIANNNIRLASPNETVTAVKVNYFYKAIDGYTFYYPNTPDTTMSFTVLIGNPTPQIAQATFAHQNIDQTTSATYPLKTPDLAYADLLAGKAFITSSYTGGSTVKIQRITLGYYIGETDQEYLMPVYVFLGDGNFCAYTSALSDNTVSTASAQLTPPSSGQ